MSGQPVTRTYLERIEQADIGNILDRIAEGYRISEIAPQLGVSRGFLSTHLNSTALGRECLAVARETAQRSRKHGHVSRLCAPLADAKHEQLLGWITARLSPTRRDTPITEVGSAARATADHLSALKQLRDERLPAPQNPVASAPQGLPYTQAAPLPPAVTPRGRGAP